MDSSILNNIISSSISTDTKSSNKWQSITNQEEFPATKNILLDELSKIFTKLVSYKVSQEAYQRYSVKLNVIDTLRDWSRVKGDIGNLPIFYDSEQSYNFLIYFLKKYLTEEILNNCDDNDVLIQVAEILLNSLKNNRSLMTCFNRVIERLICLDQTEKSITFLKYILDESNNLKLEISLVESIYISQKSHFIDKPFTDSFVAFCSCQNKIELNKFDSLFAKVTDSPTLFQLIANQLKELFVMTKYAQESQNFIQNVLEKIETECNKYNKDTLDLYPINLQFCVILLRIEPTDHTEKSKDHTVQSLKQIFLNNYHDALILVSHFPKWLPEYLGFFNELEDLTPKSEID